MTLDHRVLNVVYTCSEQAVWSLQTCVIYRDYYNGSEVLQTADFVDEQNVEVLASFLRGIRAIANNDTCENVAGGLRERFA